jgi:hypothetical protein
MSRRIFITFLLLALCATHALAGPFRGALVRIDRPSAGTAARLLDAGVPVVRNAGWYVLAVADPAQRELLDRMQYAYRVLDDSVEDKSYYTVVNADADRAGRLAQVSRVLFMEDGAAVVEAPPEAVDRLSQEGFDFQRVFMREVIPPRSAERFMAPRSSAQANPLIEDMVAQVSSPVIDGYVQRLQDFRTRAAYTDSCQAAADWIEAQFRSSGIDSVEQQVFSAFFAGNVVAVIPGKNNPEQCVVLGGHYDSAGPFNNAPGADDNASGTACVLQCARILSGYQFDRTLVFIAFGAEEQGLDGSEHYASEAAAAGDDIVAMINVDMLGYLASGDDLDVDVVNNTASQWLRDQAFAVASTYVPETPAVSGSLPTGAGSDHMSFWDHGFDAVMLWEDSDEFSPYIHTAGDTIGTSYNSSELARQSTRVVIALAADLAGPVDAATGTELIPPPAISLEQNVPNPFNPRTMIRFTVPAPGASASLRIYDVAGREVAVLVDDEIVAGTRTAWWNGTSRRGEPVASGVYFYRLTAGQQTLTRKLVLVR